MSLVKVSGNASGTGTLTIAAPNTNSDFTLTLPQATGTFNISGAANEVPAGTVSAPAIYPTGDTNTGIFFPAADTIAFAEGGAEAMRIDSAGTLGIGVTPAAWSGRNVLQVGNGGVNYGGVADGGSSGFYNNGYWNGSNDKAISTGYSQIVACNDNGSGRVLILTTSGTSSAGANISYTAGPFVSAGGTSWTNSSDERLKNITGEIQNGISKIMSLRAAEFTWKDDPNNKPCVGLIAQDVQAVLSEAVNTTTKYNSEDATEYLGVSYTETIPLLVAAIKEQQALITALTTRITALEQA